MRFSVAPEVFRAFPGMRIVVAVAAGIDNRRRRPQVEAAWEEAWAGAGERASVYGNSQSHPRVRPWRERMRAVGVSGKRFPTSIEALLRRAMKGGAAFSVNPLVDFYNTVSLRHVVPAGGFDLGELDGDLALRSTVAGDTFQALDESAPEPVPEGELAYASGHTVLTRHVVWRQARSALITADTRMVFLVSEIVGELEEELVGQVRAAFAEGLRSRFDAKPRIYVVSEAAASIDLEDES